MDWRTFRDDDLPEIAALLAQTLTYDRPTAASVRYLLLEDPGFDPHLIWIATDPGHGRRVVGFAAGALPDERLQCPGGVKLFAVAPEYRRQGVASRLFDLVENTLRQRGVTECVAVNCGHHRLSLGLDVRYTAALCFLLSRGYEQTGTTQDMEVDLVGPEAPDLSTEAGEARLREQGIAVRRATAADRDWVTQGVEREMAPPVPSRRWAYLADQAFRSCPPTIEVAEDTRTGAFLGFAAYNAARWGVLGPMGVAPQARHKGLGSVLLKRCLRDMQADGFTRGEIFSVGPILFYGRTIGARISRVYYRYAKRL
jgi:ribosomal protein S18 acetylase RimI-like enzyme